MARYLYYPRTNGVVVRTDWNGTGPGIMQFVRRGELIDEEFAAAEAATREIAAVSNKPLRLALAATKSWLETARHKFPITDFILDLEDEFHGLPSGTLTRTRVQMAQWIFVCESVMRRQPELRDKYLGQVRDAANLRKAAETEKRNEKEEKRQEKIAEIKAALPPAKRSHKKKPVAP